MDREELKITLKFRMEDEQVKLSPLALSRELRKKMGDVEMAKVLRDGNLLVKCEVTNREIKCCLLKARPKKL